MHYLTEEVGHYRFGFKRLRISYLWLHFFVVGILSIRLLTGYWGSLQVSEERFYPEGGVKYLKENPSDGEVFSYYGWGGYLIWKYPEKKVFIDGRMPSWKGNGDKDNLESSFETYRKLIKGEEGYAGVFDRFGVDTVLWPVKENKKELDKYLEKQLFRFLKIVGKEPKNNIDFMESLLEGGFEIVYSDDVSVVYRER
jgi:hypothetical protein